MKSILTSLALIVASGVASAEELSLNEALEGATLSDGQVEMSVYYTDVDAGVSGQIYTFSRVGETLNVDATYTWTQVASK